MTEAEQKLKELDHKKFILYALHHREILRIQERIDYLEKEKIKILKEFNLV